MDVRWTTYASGVCALETRALAAEDLAQAIAGAAAGKCFALVFSSDPELDLAALAEVLARLAPDLGVSGCTTAGEIVPEGIVDGAVLALLFPASRFAVTMLAIERIATTPMTAIAEAVSDARRRHRARRDTEAGETFAVCLIDGMSYAEEMVTSAIFWGLEDIPLVGGSAGDSLAFDRTLVIAGGSARSDRAVVALFTTRLPFQPFKSDNFVPVDRKFVVTASDPERRIVRELNARPAALEYAETIGKSPAEMTPMGFASNPLVLRVGGEHYCRAIRGVDADNSLAFACAIDDGVVLTLAEARGMVESTRTTLEAIDERIGGIDFVLGFDCAYRRIDAANRQVIRKMSALYRRFNMLGFGTYGEQYQSVHLNQTLTGIAFGRPDGGVLRAAAE